MQGSASLVAGLLVALGASTLLAPRYPDSTCAQTCAGSPIVSAGTAEPSWVLTLVAACGLCVAEAWVIRRLCFSRGGTSSQRGSSAASSVACLTDDVSGQSSVGGTPSSLGRARRTAGSSA